MFSSTIIAFFIASAAIAAPTPAIPQQVNDASLVTRATTTACSNPNLFQNPGFNSTGPAVWTLSGEAGPGSVSGAYQKTYFPTYFPSYGGPSAYALNFKIPAGQSKQIDLAQSVPATDGKHEYDMSLAMWLYGTTTASCTAGFHSGSLDLGTSLSYLPPVKDSLPSGGFYMNKVTVGGNNYNGINPSNGFIFTCTAGSTAADVTIYLDNASLSVAC